MTLRCALTLAAIVATAACGGGSPYHSESRKDLHAPAAAASGRGSGLTPRTARVVVLRTRRVRPLSAEEAARVLALVQEALPHAGALAPYTDGPRLLANLRLNEHLVDIALGVPQPLAVGPRRIPEVSRVVIPFTGTWRKRILVVREGRVEASRPLLGDLRLADLEWMVEREDGHP